MTHLFTDDVLAYEVDQLPAHWNMWESQMTRVFSAMVDEDLAKVTNMETTPRHSHLISQMAVARGGLGIQHPRSNAIPTMVLTIKRIIQYATQGIYLGPTVPQHKLPSTITNVYKNWKTSSSKLFQFFQEISTGHMQPLCE